MSYCCPRVFIYALVNLIDKRQVDKNPIRDIFKPFFQNVLEARRTNNYCFRYLFSAVDCDVSWRRRRHAKRRHRDQH